MNWNALEAVATAFTGVVSLVALWYAARSWKAAQRSSQASQEQLELQRTAWLAELDRERRAQASQVWVTHRHEGGREEAGGWADYSVKVHNASALPIWDVVVRVQVAWVRRLDGELQPLCRQGAVPDGELLTEVILTDPGVVPAESPKPLPQMRWTLPALYERDSQIKGQVTMEFRDASGARWRRADDGLLTELTDTGKQLQG